MVVSRPKHVGAKRYGIKLHCIKVHLLVSIYIILSFDMSDTGGGYFGERKRLGEEDEERDHLEDLGVDGSILF
jgi:hypothetical protein